MGFMNKDEIMEILKIVAGSGLAELHLESGDLKLIVKKHAGRQALPETKAAQEKREEAADFKDERREQRDRESAKVAPAGIEAAPQKAGPPVVPEAKGVIQIQAPMLGTFYRAPKPGAPPFVEVGQRVTEEDVVCIIEVMKLFNTVKAGVRGRIAKICAENAQLVEYKQVLFLVEESPEDETREGRAS